MKTIGITGGVGSGKSQVLSVIKEYPNVVVYLADEIAAWLQLPGEECYQQMVDLLGSGILNEDGTIDKNRMASAIFAEHDLLAQVNDIIHPAVKRKVFQLIKEAKESEKNYFFLEAALLIEEGYQDILDELWFVYADDQTRIDRLIAGRGYSTEKCISIMRAQLSEEEFRRHCKVVIDNSGSFEETRKQILQILGE